MEPEVAESEGSRCAPMFSFPASRVPAVTSVIRARSGSGAGSVSNVLRIARGQGQLIRRLRKSGSRSARGCCFGGTRRHKYADGLPDAPARRHQFDPHYDIVNTRSTASPDARNWTR